MWQYQEIRRTCLLYIKNYIIDPLNKINGLEDDGRRLNHIHRHATVSAVTPFCSTSKDVALCTKLTNNAPTWEVAMYNAIKYELAVLKAKQSIAYSIGSKLPDDLEPEQKQDVIDTCIKVYAGMTENLKTALGLIKKDPARDLPGQIQISYFAGCIEEFQDVSQISAPADVKKLADEIANNNDVLLDLAFNRPKA